MRLHGPGIFFTVPLLVPSGRLVISRRCCRLRENVNSLPSFLSLSRCPVLCVQSRKDEVVAADSPRIILDGVSSEKKAMLWLEDAPHVCTISPECGKIAEAIGQFLAAAEGKNAPEKD